MGESVWGPGTLVGGVGSERVPTSLEGRMGEAGSSERTNAAIASEMEALAAFEESIGLYPPARATHEQVTEDRELFMHTLRQFHSDMGIPLVRPPHMAGKEVDLHLLYVSVTSRGGLEKVIQEKKLKEVATVFKLPATCTSGSFTLRKIYVKLLHDYEQVYFFNTQGKPVPAPLPAVVANRSTTPSGPRDIPEKQGGAGGLGLPSGGIPLNGNTTNLSSIQYTVPYSIKRPVPTEIKSMVGTHVSGEIVSSTDVGYVAKVTINGQQYKGILYEPMPEKTKSANMNGADVVDEKAMKVSKRIAKRRRQKLLRQQGVPKQNKTAFNYFSMDARPQARILCGEDVPESEVSKKIGEMWAQCTPDQRSPYLARADEDRQRYNAELALFYEKNCLNGDLVDIHDPSSIARGSSVPSVLQAQHHHHHHHQSMLSALTDFHDDGPAAAAAAAAAVAAVRHTALVG